MSAGFEKAGKSSTARVADGKVIKRRHSNIRDTDLFNVQIKVSRPVDGTSVTVERLDEHIHTRDIEESFRTKKPSILLGCIESEASKNYSAAQIYHAVRGAGTYEGSERNWLQTASKWAMYARQHSPLLPQVTITNACEAWHRKLKSGAG